MKSKWFKCGEGRIRKHLEVLCEQIGVRLTGEAGEQAAADYIEQQFRKLGLDSVRQERFRFPNCRIKRIKLKAGAKRATRNIPCGPHCYSPATPTGGVKGRIVYLQSGLDLDFKGKNLKGKIGLIVGTESIIEESFRRRLGGSGLAGLITVDSRIVYGGIYPIGAAPQWCGRLKVPMVSMPYREAIELVRALPLQGHLVVDSRCSMDESQNVIGQRTGRTKPEEIIYVSGHHDSVHDCVGASDNASGVIFALEIARLLRRRRLGRTVRFVSFGAEERLSLGAYVHVRLLGREVKQVKLAVNADGIGETIGVDTVRVTAAPQAKKLVAQHYRSCEHPAKVIRIVSSFSDHFPFNIAGVPSLYLDRVSLMDGEHWTLHTKLDNIENSDPGVLARNISTAARLVDRLASMPRFPIARSFGKDLAPQVRKGAKEAYRHPWPMRKIDGLWTVIPPDKRWKV